MRQERIFKLEKDLFWRQGTIDDLLNEVYQMENFILEVPKRRASCQIRFRGRLVNSAKSKSKSK